jgi:transposase
VSLLETQGKEAIGINRPRVLPKIGAPSYLMKHLELTVIQMIEFYGARWKIESGFKELKQDMGSQKSQPA